MSGLIPELRAAIERALGYTPGSDLPAEVDRELRSLEEQLEAAHAQAGSLDGLYEQAKLRAQRAEEQLEAHERLYAACLAFQSDDHESWKAVIHAMDGIAAVSSPASEPEVEGPSRVTSLLRFFRSPEMSLCIGVVSTSLAAAWSVADESYLLVVLAYFVGGFLLANYHYRAHNTGTRPE